MATATTAQPKEGTMTRIAVTFEFETSRVTEEGCVRRSIRRALGDLAQRYDGLVVSHSIDIAGPDADTAPAGGGIRHRIRD